MGQLSDNMPPTALAHATWRKSFVNVAEDLVHGWET